MTVDVSTSCRGKSPTLEVHGLQITFAGDCQIATKSLAGQQHRLDSPRLPLCVSSSEREHLKGQHLHSAWILGTTSPDQSQNMLHRAKLIYQCFPCITSCLDVCHNSLCTCPGFCSVKISETMVESQGSVYNIPSF